MKARRVSRLALLGIAAGLVAAVGVPAGLSDGGVADLVLAGRSTDTDARGSFGRFPRPGPPIVVTPDDGGTTPPSPGRTPVGAERDDPAGPPVVVKPGEGDPKTPVPAERVPDTGQGGIGDRTGLRFVSATSVVSRDDEKLAVATCPAGTRIYGGGGKIRIASGATGSGSRLMLDSLRPTTSAGGVDAFVASAKRRNVDDNEAIALFDWSVEAYAVCGRNLPGYQHVVAKDVALDRRVTATAACPTGTRVIGVGGAVGDPFDMFSLDQLTPDLGGTSVSVTGVDDTTDGVRSAFRSVLAVAVCAVAPDGYEVVSRQSGSTSVKISSCPGDKIAYSAGFSKQDETGHTVISEAMLAQLVADPGRTAPSSTRITAKNVESLSENDLTAVTICAS